jgi:hypothetical protein
VKPLVTAARDRQYCTCPVHFGRCNTNSVIYICVLLHKVVKASTILSVTKKIYVCACTSLADNIVLALSTLGDMIQTEIIIFVSCCLSWPRQGQHCLLPKRYMRHTFISFATNSSVLALATLSDVQQMRFLFV